MANLGIHESLRVDDEAAGLAPGHAYHREDWPEVPRQFGEAAPSLRSGSQDTRRKGELAHGFPRGASPGEFVHGEKPSVNTETLLFEKLAKHVPFGDDAFGKAELGAAALGSSRKRGASAASAAIESERKRARQANYDPAAMGQLHRPTPLGRVSMWKNWRVPRIAQLEHAGGTFPASGPLG